MSDFLPLGPKNPTRVSAHRASLPQTPSSLHIRELMQLQSAQAAFRHPWFAPDGLTTTMYGGGAASVQSVRAPLEKTT